MGKGITWNCKNLQSCQAYLRKPLQKLQIIFTFALEEPSYHHSKADCGTYRNYTSLADECILHFYLILGTMYHFC